MSSTTTPGNTELAKPFVIACDGATDLGCLGVLGFAEAVGSVFEGTVAPARLAVDGPDARTSAFLDAWSEDVERVRRTLTIRRQRDAAEVVVVATVATHGYGVATSLAIESVAPNAFDFSRSGVHPRADLAATAARFDHDRAE